jgi:hypothetical protein
MHSLPNGNHLISVFPGGQSTRYNIDPKYAPMIAAGRVAVDAISTRLANISALRVPENRQPLTEHQIAAWKAFNQAMGDERLALEYCSYREAAEEGLKAMQEEAEKLLEHPVARKAYEKFLLIAELTKEHKNGPK